MSTAMERYIEMVKQYPGQEQVDLAVEIEVPGSWFGVGLPVMGSLASRESDIESDGSSAAEEVEEDGEED